MKPGDILVGNAEFLVRFDKDEHIRDLYLTPRGQESPFPSSKTIFARSSLPGLILDVSAQFHYTLHFEKDVIS